MMQNPQGQILSSLCLWHSDNSSHAGHASMQSSSEDSSSSLLQAVTAAPVPLS